MARKSSRSPADLPQTSDVWFIATAQLRLWITPQNLAPYRPYIIFVISHDTGAILADELTESEPAFDDLRSALLSAMQKPPRGVAQPSQPKGIIVTSEALGKSFIEFFAASKLKVDHLNFWRRTAGAVEWLKAREARQRKNAPRAEARPGGSKSFTPNGFLSCSC